MGGNDGLGHAGHALNARSLHVVSCLYTAAHSVSKSTASITIAMRHLKSISRKQVEASKRVKIGMLSSSNGLAYDDTNFKVVERVSRPLLLRQSLQNFDANHFEGGIPLQIWRPR